MSTWGRLTGLMESIFAQHPAATPAEAVVHLRNELACQPVRQFGNADEALVNDIFDEGLKSYWRSFTRSDRRDAVEALQAASARSEETLAAADLWRQTKLPLPDADESPVIDESRLEQVQRSIAYLRRMSRTMTGQIRRLEMVARQLSHGVLVTNNHAMSVREATDLGYIDWKLINAA